MVHKLLKWWIAVALLLLVLVLALCSNPKPERDASNTFRNLNDTVDYVGMEACKNCHYSIYKTFIQTGMGQSFDRATKSKSAAVFGSHAIVYDSINNFYYHPFWKADSLFVHEYRLDGNDTVYSRKEHISYIVGSGQHTNSHICSFNGFLYQAPITFYTQSKQWDMAPGFEGGYNSRFSRMIGFQCMTCHNAMPGFDKGSMNKFTEVPRGINCERCHGPGELHVKEKLAGIFIDTSKGPDYSIVNPRRLTKELQMSLCQRCHLQGITVLRNGKNFDDFKPGMHLSDVMNTFLPRYQNAQKTFLMASQAERLRKSQCYKNSEMSCITCHNPHISVKDTPIETFNTACKNCHSNGQKSCSLNLAEREQADNNCAGCHMPKSGSIDIPHVAITDHFIRKPSAKEDNRPHFLSLKCMTEDDTSPKTMAQGYLAFYEQFSQQQHLLDSAANYIKQASPNGILNPLIHLYYLRQDFTNIIKVVSENNATDITDPWTNYRVGEAYFQTGTLDKALEYYSKASDAQPLNLEFRIKKAGALVHLSRIGEAKQEYEFILKQQPKYPETLSNLGYLYIVEGKNDQAERLLNGALALNPDYELAYLNKATLFIRTHQMERAKELLIKVLNMNPENKNASRALQQLESL